MTYTCDVFGISRQAYYKQKVSLRAKQEQAEGIIAKVQVIRQSMPRIGTRKLYYLLDGQLSVGRDKLFSILRANQMLVKPVRSYTKTTMSKHWLHKHPNLLKEVQIQQPEQVYVSDITYIKSRQRTHYLSLITDAYSRKIVGWVIGDSLEAKHTVEALRMALEQLPKGTEGLIHHSDRGVQYCCNDYVKVLNNKNIKISMTENGDPRENAIAERVNGILKDEWLNQMKLETLEQAVVELKRIIMIYNNHRPHLSLDMKTPEFAHSQTGEFKKHWKTYYNTSNSTV